MGKKIKKASFWIRRRSHLPIIILGTVIVAVLYFNEETSVSRNIEYERQINELKLEIASERDSARYYRERRIAIESGESDLEHLAREQYHMQRPTEDVFIIREGADSK